MRIFKTVDHKLSEVVHSLMDTDKEFSAVEKEAIIWYNQVYSFTKWNRRGER